MREFVAIDLAPGGAAGGRAPQHLTLRFLGEVDPAQNPELGRRLSEVAARSHPFSVRVEGIGAFPTPSRPRVVWVGVTDGRPELVALASAVRAAVADLFSGGDDEFVPHLTLFRVRSPSDRSIAAELLAGQRPAPPSREVSVRELLLKRSILGSGGAVHETLARFPLGIPPPA